MAHNLMNRNGRYGMFCVGDRKAAWHELGQRTENAVSWREAMTLADLDWEVVKQHLYSADGKQLEAYGIFRSDDSAFLGAVGARYTPIQNRDAFDFVDSLLENIDGSHYESAGALGNGERIWCLASVPFDFSVAGDADLHKTYLMFTTAHDGSMSASSKTCIERVVCENTLQIALAESGTVVRIKHTKSAQERMAASLKLVQGIGSNLKALQEKLTRLADTKVTRESVVRVLDRLFPAPKDGASPAKRENILSDVLARYESNDNGAIPAIAGTGYNLFNAVTEYVDHGRSARGSNGDASVARATSALFGSGERLKQDALEVIIEETQANGRIVSRPFSGLAPVAPTSGSSLLDSVVDATA